MQHRCKKCYMEESIISVNNIEFCAKCICKLSKKKWTNNCESYTIIPAKFIETESTCWIIDSETIKPKPNSLMANPIHDTELETIENNLYCNVCYETPFFIQMDCCSYTTCIQCQIKWIKQQQHTSNDPIHCMHCQQEYQTRLSIDNPYALYFTPNKKYGILIHQEREEAIVSSVSYDFFKFMPLTFLISVILIMIIVIYYIDGQ